MQAGRAAPEEGLRRADAVAAGLIGLSAMAYLVAFGSNLAAGLEYYRLARESPAEYAWMPITFAVMVVAAHSFTALAFRFHLRDPFPPASLFLPLLQLRRLLHLLLAAGSLKGLAETEAAEKRTFFSFMAAAVETAPHLQLQITFILLKFTEAQGSKVIWLSLAASFLSGVGNNVMAVASVSAYQSWSSQHKAFSIVAAGFFTLAVLILGCLSFMGMAMWETLPLRILFISVPPFILCAMYLYLWKEEEISESMFNKVIRMFVLGYASLTVGPIYPLAYHASSRKEHGTQAHRYKLLVIGGFLLTFYIVVFVICFLGPLSSRWFSRCVDVFRVAPYEVPCLVFVPMVVIALGLFILSMICYMVLLDKELDINIHTGTQSLLCAQGIVNPFHQDIDMNVNRRHAAQMLEGDNLCKKGYKASAPALAGSRARHSMRLKSISKLWASLRRDPTRKLKRSNSL